MFIDPIYIIFSIPALILVLSAQILVKVFYSKFSKVGNSAGLTGVDVVEKISRTNNLDIKLNISMGQLDDHYNPRSKEITLSEQVARTPSIASIGIAAHEMGHAIQHRTGSLFINIRNFLVPVVNLGSTLGYILFLVGLSLQMFQLAIVGVGFFALSTVFTILTLPIEIDASVKALGMIQRLNIFSETDLGGVKKVLTAAALTYVAAIAQSLSSLLYFLFRAFGVRRRD
ncbi:MAG: zinc metallopeptidase [Candidatus Dojkabacteria bacterium]|nr:zinc metallopeptidase [Candidatus Dojkabacteria bacterium]